MMRSNVRVFVLELLIRGFFWIPDIVGNLYSYLEVIAPESRWNVRIYYFKVN